MTDEPGGSASSPASDALSSWPGNSPRSIEAIRAVEQFAASERLFRRSRKILAAVSGGPDSLAMLLVLATLRQRHGFALAAAHFDHQLRPGSADDMAFVREVCATLGIECSTGEGDVAAVARQQRQSIETVARMMRYQFLGFVAGREEADRIATGHTADDQAETVLHRIVRGSGVRGIRGMLPLSPVPGSEAQLLIRPLLCLTREETERICADAGIEPIRDASNDDPAHLRNRLRHEVLPLLRELNPSVSRSLVGLAASAREAFEPIDRASRGVQPRSRGEIGAIFDLAGLRALPTEALGVIIERESSFFSLTPALNRTRIGNLRDVLRSGSGEVGFGDIVVEASSGAVRVGPRLAPVPELPATLLNVPGATRVGERLVEVSTKPLPATPGATLLELDRSAMRGVMRIRPLAPGDRIRRGDGTRDVVKLLQNAKTPRWDREGLVVITSGELVVAVLGAPAGVNPPPREETRLYVRIAPLPTPKVDLERPEDAGR